MASAADLFRQSDVTRWGIVALVSGAIAIMAANVSALLPSDALARLHLTRFEGATTEQLRSSVADLERAQSDLRRQGAQIASRMLQFEQSDTESLRRIGALEVSVPRLLEQIPVPMAIDTSLPTASIGTGSELIDVDGGQMRISQQPLLLEALAPPSQALPPEIEAASEPETVVDSGQFGIAIGSAFASGEADTAWDDLTTKLGPLLLGLDPLVAAQDDDETFRLIAGPTNDLAEASVLCGRLERIAIACEPMPYAGTRLAQEAGRDLN